MKPISMFEVLCFGSMMIVVNVKVNIDLHFELGKSLVHLIGLSFCVCFPGVV